MQGYMGYLQPIRVDLLCMLQRGVSHATQPYPLFLPQRAKLQSWGDNLQWAVKKATLGETVPHKTTDSQAVDEWQPFICIILDPQSADMLL